MDMQQSAPMPLPAMEPVDIEAYWKAELQQAELELQSYRRQIIIAEQRYVLFKSVCDRIAAAKEFADKADIAIVR